VKNVERESPGFGRGGVGVWFQNAARPRKISIPSYCFVKRLTSFGTKLARNVKKGKEEKRDGEREERG
jgi:hypothetical protein